jgi:hypothetical protein
MPPKVFKFASVRGVATATQKKTAPKLIGRSALRSKTGVMAGRLSYLGGNRGNQGRNQA